MQERLESSDLGRVLISAFLLVTLIVVFASNLPRLHDSELKRHLSRIGTPYLGATGIHQSWSVFAPEPAKQNAAFRARVEFADGSHTLWQPPEYEPFIGSFREGRWGKWEEAIQTDVYGHAMLESTAIWIARRYATEEHRPVRVIFIRLWQDLPPPGSSDAPLPWRSQEYFEFRVRPGLLDGDASR